MINVKYEKKNIKLAKYKKHETTRKKPWSCSQWDFSWKSYKTVHEKPWNFSWKKTWNCSFFHNHETFPKQDILLELFPILIGNVTCTTWKNWDCQYFQNYLVTNTTWKFRLDHYFQVILDTFPGSFGNLSSI
jgi:hypothetical protein